MNCYDVPLSIHFLVKCRIIYILVTVMTPPLRIKSLICTGVFPCLTLSWHTLVILRTYVIENKLDFVSFDDKNLQRRRKFVGERAFPIENSHTDKVQYV